MTADALIVCVFSCFFLTNCKRFVRFFFFNSDEFIRLDFAQIDHCWSIRFESHYMLQFSSNSAFSDSFFFCAVAGSGKSSLLQQFTDKVFDGALNWKQINDIKMGNVFPFETFFFLLIFFFFFFFSEHRRT
jgi:hypothetical protein